MTININMTPVNSSQIHSIGHDAATNTLAIRFKSHGEPAALYHYQNVTVDAFSAFKEAKSVGSHFYKHIKADTESFPFQRINEEKTEE